IGKVFAAYRPDWDAVNQFFADGGFTKARDVVNYYADPVDLPTVASRGGQPIRRLRREDLPVLAEMGRGVIRLPRERLEAYFYARYFKEQGRFPVFERVL